MSIFPHERVDLTVEGTEPPFGVLFVGDFGPSRDRWAYAARKQHRGVPADAPPPPRPRRGMRRWKIDKDSFDEELAAFAPDRSDGRPAHTLGELDGDPATLWRALRWAVDRIDYRENVRTYLLDLTKEELAEDLAGDPRESELYAAAHYFGRFPNAYYCKDGGPTPVGLIVGCFEVGPGDLALLAKCAEVAAMACAPFIATASPALFGKSTYADLPRGAALEAHFAALEGWSALRARPAARFAGLCLPDLTIAERRVPATFAVATAIVRSFERYRWPPNYVGPVDGAIDGAVADAAFGDRQEYELSQQGLTAFHTGRDHAYFVSSSALLGGDDSTGSLPYTFVIARVAHCLRRLWHWDQYHAQALMGEWLADRTCDEERPAPAVRARRPFRRASVVIHEREADREYVAALEIEPHAKAFGRPFTLRLEFPLRTGR